MSWSIYSVQRPWKKKKSVLLWKKGYRPPYAECILAVREFEFLYACKSSHKGWFPKLQKTKKAVRRV